GVVHHLRRTRECRAARLLGGGVERSRERRRGGAALRVAAPRYQVLERRFVWRAGAALPTGGRALERPRQASRQSTPSDPSGRTRARWGAVHAFEDRTWQLHGPRQLGGAISRLRRRNDSAVLARYRCATRREGRLRLLPTFPLGQPTLPR